MKKKLSVLLVMVMLFSMPLSIFAKQKDSFSELSEKAVKYDLSKIEDAGKFYSENPDAQMLIQNLSEGSMNEMYEKAFKISKDKTNNKSKEMTICLDKLIQLEVIDKNYKIKTHINDKTKENKETEITLIPKTPGIDIMTDSKLYAYPSFDLDGECKRNSNSLKSVYDTNYKMGLVTGLGNHLVAYTFAYGVAGTYFAERVKGGGIWDFKNELGLNNYYVTTRDGITSQLKGETIGNFHYGYVGATIFPDTILLSAAGLIQIISKTSHISYYNSYFDDPADQGAIRAGIYLYDSRH